MKVKLLKKIRKRYSWYFKKDKTPILIDHSNKTVEVYDVDYVSKAHNYTEQQIQNDVKVPLKEWCYRWFRVDIFKTFGIDWKVDKNTYKLAVKKYNKKLPK